MTIMYEVEQPQDINIFKQLSIIHVQEATISKPFDMNSIYIAPSKLTEGIITSEQIKELSDIQPFFVVGYGKNSIEWLQENSRKLQEIGALPYAINLKSKSEYQELKRAYQGELIVTNMDVFKKRYAINHYPFLVANGWVEQ